MTATQIQGTTQAEDDFDASMFEALRESIAGVLAEHCGSTQLHAFIDGKNALDKTLWAQAGSLGWLGVGIPEQYGGLDLGARGLALVHGEIGQQSAPGPYIATLSAGRVLVECADEATQATWLPRLASGEISAAVPAALDEAALTRDSAGVSGELRCLGNAEAAFVLAPVADDWAIVELSGADIAPVGIWDRTREVIDVRFRDAKPLCVLPGAQATRRALTRAMALAIAADGAGGARSITERTIEYMKTRQQFGQPIAGFQALKHRAADLVTRLAVMDETLAHAVERTTADAPDADIWVSLAKSEVTEAAVFVTTDCVQLHGGVGFTWDFDPHIYLKRARLNEVLVMANTALRDRAADDLAAVTMSGGSALELEA
ncbi:MAG: acyl-CoA/acyl-ACP dehydrogenase [Gammaproteobacteria bacterium]|nr:acyl-CoA/acyl-ACP dehydrogenase [Gammaproteobacteria bacterium]